MRSLARAFSSSRRAPPMRRRTRTLGHRVQQGHVWSRLRVSRGRQPTTRPRAMCSCTVRTTSGSSSAPPRSRKADHLREVVAGVDVHEREREAPGPEGLLGQAQQHDAVLAAGEQQAGPLALADHLPEDVDGFGREGVDVRGATFHGTKARRIVAPPTGPLGAGRNCLIETRVGLRPVITSSQA